MISAIKKEKEEDHSTPCIYIFSYTKGGFTTFESYISRNKNLNNIKIQSILGKSKIEKILAENKSCTKKITKDTTPV